MTEFHHQLGVFEIWDFPVLEEHPDNVTSPEALAAKVREQESKMADISASLHEQMTHFDKKLALLNDITSSLQKMQSDFNESLLSNIILLIKNTVKKILHKELSLDNQLIKHMIQQAMDDINKQHEACVVYLSEVDFPLFATEQLTNQFEVRCDPGLNQGDFVIKTRLSELEAILESRLNALFGL